MKVEFEVVPAEKGYNVRWHHSGCFKSAIEYNLGYLLILRKLADTFLTYESYDECKKREQAMKFIKKKIDDCALELKQNTAKSKSIPDIFQEIQDEFDSLFNGIMKQEDNDTERKGNTQGV